MAAAFSMNAPSRHRRPCPPDFVDVYLRIGWDGIEDHYGAWKHTIKRWIDENGGDELKRRRRDAVKTKRFHAKCRHLKRGGTIRVDSNPPPEDVVSAAAHFLRHPHGGGWRVFPSGRGDWFVGIRQRSPAEVVAMAEAKGFDATAVIVRLREG